jgi:drug/metabolite transporter (DMT)-like permease
MAVSTGAIFARLADCPPLVTAAYRVGLATALLGPLALIKAGSELRRLDRRQWVLAALAGFFLALHFATWISSLFYTSVANSVVLVNTNPIWVALLAPLVTGERIGPLTAAGIVVSVAGGVIIGAADFHIGGGALVGDALALAGSVCAAAYLVLGRTLRRHLSLMAYITVCYGSAAIFLFLAVLALGLPLTGFAPTTWAALVALAVVPQLIGHTSYNWALKWFSPSMVAVSLLGEPIGATILAWILFKETVTALTIGGGTLILMAIYLAVRGEKQTATARHKAEG